ncbi:MAG: acylphosphatase [gamma proteobacterium symbiont of Bathyaustriella thionipta]|nr:acylphosphatase [gamma proteobacterium symbiont of Bathyaustriella thionipta]
MSAEKSPQCCIFIVSGRVQGVFFRLSTRQKARQLEISGHAINLPDGMVEVLACGKSEALDALEAWLWQGPPAAQVSDVSRKHSNNKAPTGFITG